MTNNSLIAGMEEVIAHIQKLEKEKESLSLILKGKDDVREECIKGYREQVEKVKEEHKEKMEQLVGEVQQYEQQLHGEEELKKEIKKLEKELDEVTKCEEDGYAVSKWFREKLDFHIKYHFTNVEGGEYTDLLLELEEKPECLDDLIFGSMLNMKDKIKKLQSKVAELEKFKMEAEDTTASFPVMESMMDQLEQKDKQIEENDKQIKIQKQEVEKLTKSKDSNIVNQRPFGNIHVQFDWNIVNDWISSFIDSYSDGHYCDSDELNLEDEVQEALFEDVAKELNDSFNACLFDRYGNVENGYGDLQEACWDSVENMIIQRYLGKMKVAHLPKGENKRPITMPFDKYRDIVVNGEEDTDGIIETLHQEAVDKNKEYMEQVEKARAELGDHDRLHEMTVEELKQLLADAGDPEYSQ